MFNADAMRFKQILMNLVATAIKFTPADAGSSWSPVGWKTNHGEVRDNGPGIPPDEQQRISKAVVA